MKLIKILKEELKDIPTTKKLYHRTNIENLMGIIEDGHLLGSKDYASEKEYYDKDEISTARKSTFSSLDAIKKTNKKKFEIEIYNLSDNIGNVEFILFENRIIGSHLTRGIRKRPIAEIPIDSIDTIKEIIDNILKKDPNKKKQMEKDFINIKKLEEENIISIIKKYRPEIEDIKDFFEKEIYYLKNALKNLKKYLINREGEERLYSEKKIKIPLHKDLMKIKFLEGIDEELKDLNRNKREKLQDFILKNKDLFVNNQYRNMVTSL
jgi:hypothetical protein